MDTNDIETARDLAHAATRQAATGRNLYAVVPHGHSVESLEHLQDRPNRLAGNRTFIDVKSLADYLARFEQPSSIAFSDAGHARITTVIDYHEGQGEPAFGEHSASYQARKSVPYAAWCAIDERVMQQREAIEFLEDRAKDVQQPDPATIMDLIMTFEGMKKVNFVSNEKLHDGRRQFTYEEEHVGKREMVLPEQITLFVPVFEGSDPQKLNVRIRFRMNEDGLTFRFQIAERTEVEREAFNRSRDQLATDRPDLLVLNV